MDQCRVGGDLLQALNMAREDRDTFLFRPTVLVQQVTFTNSSCTKNLQAAAVTEVEAVLAFLTFLQALPPNIISIRQGLSYRAQFFPVTVTKIWTPYSQTNFFYKYTKKFLTSRAFHPCRTLGVKENRKLVKKIFEVKKSPRNGTFCLPLFLVTQVYAVVTAKSAIG